MRHGHRTPEVIVKVISPGSNCLRAIRHHFGDLQKGQSRSLETDFFNTPVTGHKAVRELIDDWDLDLDELLCRVTHLWGVRSKPPKLVHKIIFSMPAGTPPDRLLAAVRDFAQNEYAPKHRYALALHTDEPHPHVHVVMKAISEEGERLNIRKATLREWRKAFARHLRNQWSRFKGYATVDPRKSQNEQAEGHLPTGANSPSIPSEGSRSRPCCRCS